MFQSSHWQEIELWQSNGAKITWHHAIGTVGNYKQAKQNSLQAGCT